MRQKETATNLVYFYNLDTIKSLDELGVCRETGESKVLREVFGEPDAKSSK